MIAAVFISLSVGGSVGTLLASVSDAQNGARIDANTSLIESMRDDYQEISQDIAVIKDRQDRIQLDIAEIKEALRER